MTKPLQAAAISLAVCVSLTGRPQDPAQAVVPPQATTPSSMNAGVPPEVDAALRSRVNEFYQDHVNGKYRAADALVSEDSKDAFFAMSKPHIKSFDVTRIDYSENYSKAEVSLMCTGDWFIRGQKMTVKIPLHEKWRLENGQWFWYFDQPPTEIHTPFGVVRKEPGAGAEASATAREAATKDPVAAARTIRSRVTLDKNTVTLKVNRNDSAEVSVKNDLPGAISVRAAVLGEVPGLKVTVDKETIGGGETAKVLLSTEAKKDITDPPKDARVAVSIEPINQVLSFSVQFVVAPPEPAAEPAKATSKPKAKKKKKSKKTSS